MQAFLNGQKPEGYEPSPIDEIIGGNWTPTRFLEETMLLKVATSLFMVNWGTLDVRWDVAASAVRRSWPSSIEVRK